MNNTFIQYITEECKDNKYTKWYISLCERGRSRLGSTTIKAAKEEATEIFGYVEGHHIWPKTMCSSNAEKASPLNIVFLTEKEHRICHKLLTKMTDNWLLHQGYYAFLKFSNKRTEVLSKAELDRMREVNSICATKRNTGRKHTEETKALMRCSALAVVRTEEHKHKISAIGHIHASTFLQTPEVFAKRSSTQRSKGSLHHSKRPEVRAKISSAKKGKRQAPKWLYQTPYGVGDTEFIKELSIRLNTSTVILIQMTKDTDRKITRVYQSKILTTSDIGKSYRELGWGRIML